MSQTNQSDWLENSELKLTEKAAQVFKEACESEGNSLDESYLRVGANAGGCSGYKYELDWNSPDDLRPNDQQFESHGVKLVVDKTCLHDILGAVEIDYTDKNMVEQGFVFKQLRQGVQCGCGESFTAVKDLK
ncbi:MAG: iron-sulfur cluster assembly accessory protein [SAR324 cluster bacterium]|nr:iron-sulfur cluster assembly accessory protein [SAR324 cluster bacterium]